MAQTFTLEGLRKARRRFVKRHGKRAFRRFNEWLASQSTVSNEPVLAASEFPWTADFEREWPTMRKELDQLLQHRESLPMIYEITQDNYAIGQGDLWKTFWLYGYGYQSALAPKVCPETTRLLATVPNLKTAFLSIMAPGNHVPLHRGLTKGLIRCHLPLKVPKDRERCTMTLDGVPYAWEEGRLLIFDDTYFHEVHNDTDEERVVLLFDFDRPMTSLGTLANRVLVAITRRTGFVQDSLRNQAEWEARFLAATES